MFWLAFLLCLLVSDPALAVTTRYVNNLLSSGANDGTTAADAWRSLEYARAGLAGQTVDVVVFTAGSGPYQEVFSTRSTAYKTDLSFAASDRSLNSVGTNLSSFSFAAGDIVRVKGSASNDRQFQIATVAASKITFIASNTVTDEAAGASIKVSSLNTGSNLAALDPGSNGTAARPRRWMFNGVEIDGSVTLNTANGYTWTQSAGNASEWYVKRSDGSNPSLLQVFGGTMDGEFVDDSADLSLDIGTVGALSAASPWGWGDNDSIGYSTLYVRSTVNPGLRVIKAAQVLAGVKTTWQYHSFEDGIISHINRDSADSVGGAGIWNASGTQWWAKRMLVRWVVMNGFRSASSSLTRVDSSVTYFAGHRGHYVSGDSSHVVNNCLDYGSHLFGLIGASVTSAGSLTIYNSVSAYNEAGAIDKKSATAVLTEGYNVWYPRFGSAGAMLGYVSAANWTTTAATDYPPSAATTTSTEAANLSAGAVDPLLRNPTLMASVSSPDVTGLQPTAASLRRTGKPRFHVIGKDGKRFNLAAFDRGPWMRSER